MKFFWETMLRYLEIVCLKFSAIPFKSTISPYAHFCARF